MEYAEKIARRNAKKIRTHWESRFQNWANNKHLDTETKVGNCREGCMCAWCDSPEGNPCARALSAMLREMGIRIDYEKQGYEAAWKGDFVMAQQTAPQRATWTRPDGVPGCSPRWVCPHCREVVYFIDGSYRRKDNKTMKKVCKYNFCPWCGKKVEKEAEVVGRE